MRLFGKKLDEAAKNRIGYMPEERGLYRDLKLEPTLVYLATLKGMSESAARVQLADWLKRLDLYEHRQKKIQDLSRGMQQKAQLIATLLHDPDLIVVDEPFANLDPVNTRLALEILEEQRARGQDDHHVHPPDVPGGGDVQPHRADRQGPHRALRRGGQDQARLRHQRDPGRGTGRFSGACPACWTCGRRTATGGCRLSPGAEPQTVFRALAGRDGVKIERFELAEPSLDDIFVAVVQRPEGLRVAAPAGREASAMRKLWLVAKQEYCWAACASVRSWWGR